MKNVSLYWRFELMCWPIDGWVRGANMNCLCFKTLNISTLFFSFNEKIGDGTGKPYGAVVDWRRGSF